MRFLGYKVKYNNWFFRFIVPVFGALLYNYYGNVDLFFNKGWIMHGFYVSLAGNYIILLIATNISFAATLIIDRVMSRFANIRKRLLLQVIFAYLIPCWIGNRIALIYLYFFDTYIGEEHYRIFIFPLMYLYLLLINEFYGLRYMFIVLKEIDRFKDGKD